MEWQRLLRHIRYYDNQPSSPLFAVCRAGGGRFLLDVVLIDEAQLTYRDDGDPLWAKLKSLTQGPQPGQSPPTLRIIMAAMYGSQPSGIALPSDASPPPTPFVFQPEMIVTLMPPGAEGVGLNLDKDEYLELIGSFNKFHDRFDGFDSEDLLQYLYDMTAGQVTEGGGPCASVIA